MVLYTIRGRSDGFGSHYLSFMTGIAFCEYKQYTYIHTPICQIDHTSEIDAMNEFIGIPKGNIPENTDEQIITVAMESEVEFSSRPSQYYTGAVLEKIRGWYYNSPKPIIPEIQIAIHIRRGDVSVNRYIERYTSNEYYIKVIAMLKEKFPNYGILIFSQGELEDFKDIIDVTGEESFRLNRSIQETFHSLVEAKIFISAKSNFSYAAAILNKNTVYYDPGYWYKPLDHWIKLEV